MDQRIRNISAVGTVALGLALAVATTVQGQGGTTATRHTGQGDNMTFTLIETKPTFFRDGYRLLRERVPDAYLRQAATDESDQMLVMAWLSDGDVMGFYSPALHEAELLDDVSGTRTWLADVVVQRRALALATTPRIGFILAAFDENEERSKRIQVSQAVRQLSGLADVLLLGRTQGTADVLVIYRATPADMSTQNERVTRIEAVLRSHFMEVVSDGITIPDAPGA